MNCFVVWILILIFFDPQKVVSLTSNRDQYWKFPSAKTLTMEKKCTVTTTTPLPQMY